MNRFHTLTGRCLRGSAEIMAALAADLAQMEKRVCDHMNADHADSMLAWAHFYAQMPNAASARMTALTTDGFVLCVKLTDGTERMSTIAYDPPPKSAAQIRKVAVAMHFKAFNGMGLTYKLTRGFYTGAVRMMWTHMPKPIRAVFAGSVVGVVAVGYMCLRRRC